MHVCMYVKGAMTPAVEFSFLEVSLSHALARSISLFVFLSLSLILSTYKS
jgi:hypothetical protein